MWNSIQSRTFQKVNKYVAKEKKNLDCAFGVRVAVKFCAMQSCLSKLAKLQMIPRQHKRNSNFISLPDITTHGQ